MPYGEVWVEDAANNSNYRTPYKFTGKELDKETGLYYFGARYYDARVGRWISPDDRFDRMYKTMGLDVYCFVHGNPILYLDPDGHLLKEFGEWLNKAGADINKAITNSSVVKELHRTDTSTGRKLAVAGGVSVGLTAASIGSAIAAPKMIGALLTTLGKEAVKQGIKKAAVSGAIQAGANVSSNVCVNHDTSVGGNITTGLVGFGVGAISSLAGTWGFFEKSVATFGIGFAGDAVGQFINNGEVNISRAGLSGFMNMVGSHITGPAIQSARELRLGESAAIQSGFTIPATWGIDALYKQP